MRIIIIFSCILAPIHLQEKSGEMEKKKHPYLIRLNWIQISGAKLPKRPAQKELLSRLSIMMVFVCGQANILPIPFVKVLIKKIFWLCCLLHVKKQVCFLVFIFHHGTEIIPIMEQTNTMMYL